MITAIFEILALLIVSCLIGVYFTYRYWKSRVSSESTKAHQASEALNQKVEKLEEQKEDLEQKLANAEKAKAPKKETTTKSKDQSKEVAELQNQIELKDQELAEKERELEELSRELEKKKISYYKQIDGKRYKAITLKMADESVEGKGDGRISKEDAEKIFATISDGKSYTQVEKDTMRYIRDHYNWTEGADELFRKKVRSWAAKGHELN